MKNINLNAENTYFPVSSLFYKQLYLSNPGFEKHKLKKKLKKLTMILSQINSIIP